MTTPAPGRAGRRGLAEESADRIREAILAGEVPPGGPLREVELATGLGVGRGSVREGLWILEREGLIRSAWHRGTTVIDITPDDIREVYAVRAALDRLAAVTARDTATEAQLGELDGLVGTMAAEVAGNPAGPRLVALDIAFHDAVYVAAGNRRLTEAWRAVRSQVHLFQLRRVALGFTHYRARVVDEHRELAGLIRSGERETLARTAEEHVNSAHRGLLAHVP
ncbi:DNA-binding GntR family transcriptional regulator [Catenuloplanes nepalensis]|uniref:DNA-binding GntR family transcriptional regulator n=1 Tax=Catenuloplanes nepalensis TaxID=587533 RepID=A0ABT9MLN0_9ACTN|nr:GntR family transcriptional regulator [Catenuloplanes nepalensis]MDP9792304.1 DNA-binding GntR family transcriptional regulator [Catenuloplanes nepalensis]